MGIAAPAGIYQYEMKCGGNSNNPEVIQLQPEIGRLKIAGLIQHEFGKSHKGIA
jgi:hypothetical protein